MDCEQDSNGASVITESGLKCTARMHRQDAIHLAMIFPLKETVSLNKKLECANHINNRYTITRAAVMNDGAVLFCDDYILLNGGVSRKVIVLWTKKFIEVTRQAIVEYVSDIVG